MNTWKENLEETKKHYTDWWNHKGIVLNMWEHFQNGVTPHAEVAMPEDPGSPDRRWFDPEWRAEYLDWYVAHSSLKADMLPVANTQLGPGSLAAILGGRFEGGEDTIWIHPNPGYTDDIKFDENNAAWKLHKDLLTAVKRKAQGHYYVGMPDLMEGLDVLAAIKGTDKVLLDTVMQPDVLERQMHEINEIYFRVYDELYDIIREGDEMAFCYFSSWAPGRMSKLQSDISTMISEADYRRFVQPFIREQTERIDYTLYHLDGVGALHHLPALLEIEGLNAIQWTPGVGEPQGGSPKWYDLYRRILGAGKSIMACWVTLDELRPLLDNIGADGVHLEMDFHNEEEVERALEIVEEYRNKPEGERKPLLSVRIDKEFDADRETERIIEKVEKEFNELAGAATVEMKIADDSVLLKAMKDRVLLLDGAMGTMIQACGLGENDFRGEEFAGHGCELRGCNDLLAITRPETVADIHRRYLEAGADIITTDTFNAQRVSLADYRLEERVRDINLAACRIARETAGEYTRRTPGKPRFVAGSMGPTSKTLSLVSNSGQPGWDTFNREVLKAAYAEQAEALVEGGADIILLETIFDIANAEAALEAIKETFERKNVVLPLMLSFTVKTPDGRNMLGQSIGEFVASLAGLPVLSVGVNCFGDVAGMIPFIEKLGCDTGYAISAYPNAGLPDDNGHYSVDASQFRRSLWPLLDGHSLNIAGGCCGTDDSHIRALAEVIEPAGGLYLSPHAAGKCRKHEPEPHAAHDGHSHAGNGDASETGNPGHLCDCCRPSVTPEGAAGSSGAPDTSAVFDAIVAGKADDAENATNAAVAAGAPPQDIINGEMIRAMSEIGRRFQDGKAFVPQLLMAGRAMKAGLAVLKPLMAGQKSMTLGKVVIGTVKGDLHDIGKNLVASMLEGCGFEVINIGIDVTAEKFVEEIRENEPDILCMSALLTTTMTYMADVIEALREEGLRDKVKVMVGGAPVTPRFAEEIGADGYSDNANSAVALARKLVGAPS